MKAIPSEYERDNQFDSFNTNNWFLLNSILRISGKERSAMTDSGKTSQKKTCRLRTNQKQGREHNTTPSIRSLAK
jgi:hypothetical protein